MRTASPDDDAFRDLDALEAEVRGLAAELGVGGGARHQPATTLALMGQGVSPGIFEVLEAMGRDRAHARLSAAVRFLEREEGAE